MRYLLTLYLSIPVIALLAQDYQWKTLKTGAGGYMTGLDIHQSGSPVYTRSDVGSAYRYDASRGSWTNIVTSEQMPDVDVYWNRFGGVLSIVSAPSDSDRAYMAYQDGIYVSDDQGDSWSRTNLPAMEMPPNDDDSKFSGERLAVDPLDGDVVYFASVNDGLWLTTDGGDTWTKEGTLPTGLPGRGVRQVLFDKSSAELSGRTSVIYVTIDGEDIYQSTDAGSTWSTMALSSLYDEPIFLDSEIDDSGVVYCVGRDMDWNSMGLQRYVEGQWSTSLDDDMVYFNVAIDPFDNNRVVLLSEGFSQTAITNNIDSPNRTWSYPTYSTSADNIPWLAWTQGDWFSIGEVVFDPVVQGRLWIAEGVGVWNIDDINDQHVIWKENAHSQEHLVSNDLVVNSDGRAITAHWDRPIFVHGDNDEYPEVHQPNQRFNSAWDMDVSPSDPNYIVAIIEDHRYCCYDEEHRTSGYSTDGGLSWTSFATMPDPDNVQGVYGNIAVAANDVNNIVWLPTGDQPPYYTTDRGNTWQQSQLPNNQGGCCLNYEFVYKKALVADRVQPNTFYLYNWENGSIYITADGGATWKEELGLADFYGWNAKVSSSPMHGGHLLYSHGAEQAVELMQPLKRSVDGGRTWTELSNTSEVLNHAVGASYPTANYPTIYIQGRVDGVLGYWLSKDEGATWTNLGDYPMGIYDIAKVMEADPELPSRLYIGYPGNGFVYGQDPDLVTVSVADNDQLARYAVYPNPSSDWLQIAGDVKVTDLSIHSVDGRQIAAYKDDSGIDQVDIRSLVPGLYFLELQQGTIVKFVKK